MDVKWTVKKAKSGEVIYYENTITGEKKWPDSSFVSIFYIGPLIFQRTNSNCFYSFDNAVLDM